MILIIVALCVLGAFLLAIFAVRGMLKAVPQEERTYYDPLPPVLRMLWPLVLIATNVVGPRLKAGDLEKTHRTLQAAGQDYLISPEEFAGVRVLAAVIGMVFCLFPVMIMGKLNIGTGLLCVAFGGLLGWMYPLLWLTERRQLRMLGWMYPLLWLTERRQLRQKKVIRDLPVYLDFITMSVEAGLNITGAIEQAVEKGPQGPLGQEFSRVLRDLRAGLPRSEALKRMADRMDIAQISSFTSALIQADRVGASLGETLRAQSMQRREERFLRAEKLALEAPVKMMAPLVMCFFPLIFIVLGYFIYLKMVQDGIL